MDRQNLRPVDISVVTGVSRTATSNWFKAGQLDDKYIWRIANAFDDERFKLAVQCYSQGIPSIALDILNKYERSPLAMLIGTQLEDTDSDSAIKNLIIEISKPNPDIKSITSNLKEIQETSQIMNAAVDTVSHRFGISIRDVTLQRSH